MNNYGISTKLFTFINQDTNFSTKKEDTIYRIIKIILATKKKKKKVLK